MTGRFDGRVVLITGTGSGIGRATAHRFAAEGATVVGCDLDPDGATETARLLAADGLAIDGTAPVDAADDEAMKTWIDAAAAAHGGIDVVVVNAGACRFGPLEEATREDWTFTLRNELDVVFVAARHAWPHLRARGGGAVALIGSTAGVTGSTTAFRTAHTASKGGVIALNRQLAAEGAPHGIRVNAVSPGMVSTAQAEATLLAPDHPMARIADHVPLRRLGRPRDVAAAITFLCSDDASYVTGANLMVDGGWSAVLPGA